MARVWYVGTYPYREITPQDWDKLGLFGPHYQWSADNGWSVDQAQFRPELLAALELDPEFQLNKEGARPDAPLPPDDVTRPWKADAAILQLVDDAFEALNLAEEALEDIQESVTAANTAATTAGTHRNAAQGFRNEAEGFKTTAGTSASTATGAAATATAKAGEASVSATAAKASETAAKASETAAKSSETKSKASETAAKASETNSKASETAAGGHAATASSRASEAAASAATLIQRINRGGREVGYLPDGRPYLLDPDEVEEVPIRVDTSVGTRVFIGDTMIHADTGWRMLGTADLINGWKVANSYLGPQLKRVGDIVYLYIPSLGLDGVDSTQQAFMTTPQGFRPAFNYATFGSVFAANGSSYRVAQDVANITIVGAPKLQVTGTFWWRTVQPWPTSLPGTPA